MLDVPYKLLKHFVKLGTNRELLLVYIQHADLAAYQNTS
jgi:hypothetical protein